MPVLADPPHRGSCARLLARAGRVETPAIATSVSCAATTRGARPIGSSLICLWGPMRTMQAGRDGRRAPSRRVHQKHTTKCGVLVEQLLGLREQPGEVESIGTGLTGGLEVGAVPIAAPTRRVPSRAALRRSDNGDVRDKSETWSGCPARPSCRRPCCTGRRTSAHGRTRGDAGVAEAVDLALRDRLEQAHGSGMPLGVIMCTHSHHDSDKVITRACSMSRHETMSLFDVSSEEPHAPGADSPLAERMRPRTLDEFVGQSDLVGRRLAPARCSAGGNSPR